MNVPLHLNECEHPRKVTNKYTGERILVSCGHCPACRVKRISRWVAPLVRESFCHKYTIFFTLTYKDEFLPKITLSSYEVDTQYRRLFQQLCNESKEWIDFNKGDLPVCPSSDIQKFVKRLRENIFRKLGLRNVIRYFISSDLGSTTFRPHWHGLLFFDDSRIREIIGSLLSSSWAVYDKVSSKSTLIGNIKFEDAYAAAKYVSSYINLDGRCPAIYQFKDFRTKSLHSSFPPIGSLVRPQESIEQIVRRGLNQITIYDPNTNTWHKTALLPHLVRRLFPRVPSFMQLIRVERFQIYRFFTTLLDVDPIARRGLVIERMQWDSFLYDYITLNGSNSDPQQICDKIDRIYYAVSRLVYQCNILHISLNDYDSLIENYFINLKKNAYKRQLNYVADYQTTHSDTLSLLCLLDPDFEQSKTKSMFYSEDKNHLTEMSLDSDYFRLMFTKYNKLIKRKCNNAYLELHPEFKKFHS